MALNKVQMLYKDNNNNSVLFPQSSPTRTVQVDIGDYSFVKLCVGTARNVLYQLQRGGTSVAGKGIADSRGRNVRHYPSLKNNIITVTLISIIIYM